MQTLHFRQVERDTTTVPDPPVTAAPLPAVVLAADRNAPASRRPVPMSEAMSLIGVTRDGRESHRHR
jgi:hypothetical protein